MSGPTFKVTDNTADLKRLLDSFKRDSVLVGIPAEDSTRESNVGERPTTQSINNASILAINEFGSPVNNIPPRAPVQKGLKLAADDIADQYRQAIIQSIKGGVNTKVFDERAGLIASQSIKRVINDQIDIKEPSDATLKNRQSRGFKGNKALIVTGQVRNAITYVVAGG